MTNTITALLITITATNWFAVENAQLEVGIVSQQSWAEIGTNRFLLSSNVVMESAPLRVAEPRSIICFSNLDIYSVWPTNSILRIDTKECPYWFYGPGIETTNKCDQWINRKLE